MKLILKAKYTKRTGVKGNYKYFYGKEGGTGGKKKPTSNIPKASMAKEIVEGMGFLGIPTARFSQMSKKYGGVEGLHKEIAKRLSGSSKAGSVERALTKNITPRFKKHVMPLIADAGGLDTILSNPSEGYDTLTGLVPEGLTEDEGYDLTAEIWGNITNIKGKTSSVAFDWKEGFDDKDKKRVAKDLGITLTKKGSDSLVTWTATKDGKKSSYEFDYENDDSGSDLEEFTSMLEDIGVSSNQDPMFEGSDAYSALFINTKKK